MRRKISKMLEKAVGAGHRPSHRAKLERALQEARHEEVEQEKLVELRERERSYRRWRW